MRDCVLVYVIWLLQIKFLSRRAYILSYFMLKVDACMSDTNAHTHTHSYIQSNSKTNKQDDTAKLNQEWTDQIKKNLSVDLQRI